jgi:hypothetical protein
MADFGRTALTRRYNGMKAIMKGTPANRAMDLVDPWAVPISTSPILAEVR